MATVALVETSNIHSHEGTNPVGVHITAVEFLYRGEYWDFSVEEHKNYWMGGVWNHNSGTTFTTCAKIVKFMMTNPPPRMDAPIWLISESYEMVCKSVWKEKMSPRTGYGLLPASEIDWERVRWLRPNQGWPHEVPLKPWPGRPGKNYTISFRSYAQGRQQMQAESIAGFCFFEQFPWGLLEEVMRGCREYAFEGNKLCEFTPVDPGMSMELRMMEEEDKLPPGWAIYRANTRCAMEAGHVSEQWYHQFFGMIPESMRRVRERGLWGGFEGAVYPEFDTAIHLVGRAGDVGEDWEIPPAWHHRRSIDWGFGLDNAFCCLWYCRNGAGEIVVYDEYYSTDTRLTVIEHLKNISDQHPWPKNPYYGVTFADPSNINCHRIASQFSQYAPGYDSINLQAANNDVFSGIEYTKWLFQPDPALAMGDGVARPRLRIHRRCRNLIKQLISYRWEQNKTGVRDARMAPVKKDDHAVDALRYGPFSEACQSGTTPQTIARLHTPGKHGVQINSSRLNRSQQSDAERTRGRRR